jgi:hypothetical protein
LIDRDYTRGVLVRSVQSVTALGDWLPDSVPVQMLDDEVVARYDAHLQWIGKLKYPAGRRTGFSSGSRLFLRYLRAIGVVAPPRVQLSQFVEEFCEWMRVHRGAASLEELMLEPGTYWKLRRQTRDSNTHRV